MNKYKIRFNKSRGEPGRGSKEHVWRVFEDSREILAKHVILNVRSWTEQDNNGNDWNIVCCGSMYFFEDTDTVIIE